MTMATIVIVQFSGTNDSWIPDGVNFVNNETRHESTDRKRRPTNGTVAISPQEQVSVSQLADQLHDAGYHVTNVFRQMREDRNKRGKKYHMLRYLLQRGDEALDSLENIRENYETVEEDLIDLLTNSFWRVRAYRNHLENGDIMISLNLELRVPRFSGGEPVKVYQRDELGHKVGQAEPIKPLAVLNMDHRGWVELKRAV